MAWQQTVRTITLPAAIDVSTFQYHFCLITAAAKVTSGTTTLTAQGVVDGVIADPGDGADSEVAVALPDGGIGMIKLGATLSAGDLIATAADGRAVAKGASNGNLGWGRLLEGGDANEIVAFKFNYYGQTNA